MKLLLDENLSPRMVELLVDLGVPVRHVRDAGLSGASDQAVRAAAAEHAEIIVTRDSDFNDLVALAGWPPKVVWLRVGNATPDQLARVLLAHRADLEAFHADAEAGLLTLAAGEPARSR